MHLRLNTHGTYNGVPTGEVTDAGGQCRAEPTRLWNAWGMGADRFHSREQKCIPNCRCQERGKMREREEGAKGTEEEWEQEKETKADKGYNPLPGHPTPKKQEK